MGVFQLFARIASQRIGICVCFCTLIEMPARTAQELKALETNDAQIVCSRLEIPILYEKREWRAEELFHTHNDKLFVFAINILMSNEFRM